MGRSDEFPRLRVTAPEGDPRSTKVEVEYAEGAAADISHVISEMTLRADANSLWTADITCRVDAVEVLSGEHVTWLGLENVPVDALRQELDRREAEFFLAGAGLEDDDA